ncbi:MAG: hypothetical protein ACPGLV_13585, partial [Bacteroidia bacterium]
KLGFGFSQDLLHALNGIQPKLKLELFNQLNSITGVNHSWTPLVKQWNIPTGESRYDHIATYFASLFGASNKGERLNCGHIIPYNTFPLERYNGCPYCGTPFAQHELNFDTVHKLKILELWTEKELEAYFNNLIESPLALDANQVEDLHILLEHFEISKDLKVGIKETVVIIAEKLISLDRANEVGRLFKTPTDILRYLWYKHTGYLQLIEPKVIANRKSANSAYLNRFMDSSAEARQKAKKELKLKFSRVECKMYAQWLNDLKMPIEKQCENMHAKRQIWIRVIRALRLAEYSKRKGFEQLKQLLDVFYREDYTVYNGKLQQYKLKMDAENTFRMLKERPGLFARSLFSTMLWFGKEITHYHFRQVMDQVPARLVYSLNMYADYYFVKDGNRAVKPLGGTQKRIPTNALLALYNENDLKIIRKSIADLSYEVMISQWKMQKSDNRTMYIAPELDLIPVAIGDRNEQIQDVGAIPQGTRFKVEGKTVRLFMQWGQGLPAQHLDMDLSCKVAYDSRVEFCSYSRLSIYGCKHSGDIQSIPNKVGTAEYIEIDIDKLSQNGAKYVSFTCNAYTRGSLSTNMMVGWMNSNFPMSIGSNGVAYSPSAVQQSIRIKDSLTKGLVFGVLDIAKREIVWLEAPFGGQIVQNLDAKGIETMIAKLDAKLKLSEVLKLKAEAQNLELIAEAEKADEIYDMQWAQNMANVNRLFFS